MPTTLLASSVKNLLRAITPIVLLAVGATAIAQTKPSDTPRKLPCDRPAFGLILLDFENTNCRSIIQDREGYIWAGTDNGIVRYDGVNVQRFANIEAGLRNYGRKILAMVEDTVNNCIWASLDGIASIARIDLQTFKTSVLEYQTAEDNGTYSYRVALSLANLDDTTLVCRMGRAFYSLSKTSGRTTLLRKYKGSINSTRTPFFEFDGRLCNVGGGRIYGVRRGTEADVTVDEIPLGDLDGIKNAVAKDDSTLIVLNLAAQEKKFDIYFIHPHSGTRELIGSITDAPHGLSPADDGIWIATNHGLAFLKYEDRSIRFYTSANSTLKDNDIACITKARNQHIFFLGTADGIATLNYFNSKFMRTDMRRYSMSNNPQVWSVAHDSQGTHWIGCLDGLYKSRPNSVFYDRIELGNTTSANGDDDDEVMILSINETIERDGIIVSTPKDVFKLAYDGRIISRILHDDDMIYGAQPLPGSRVVITCRYKVHIINTQSGHEMGSIVAENGTSFSTSRSDDMSTLWVVSTNQKLVGYDINSLSRKYIVVLQKDSIGAIRDIRHNVRGGMNELWIATVSGGLLYKNPGYSGIMPVNSGRVLKSVIHAIELDDNGGLWVATDLGIANVKDGKVTDYPKNEFHLCNKFINRASAKGLNGEILMGGRNDFIEFTPLGFIDNDYFPTPRITSYQFFNFTDRPDPELLSPHLFGGTDIDVPADVNSIRINARSLSYDHPEVTNVEWTIDGDTEWKKADNNGDIYLTALSEGNHELLLRSTNDDGEPQEGLAVLTIRKHKFFYETRFFIVVIIMAIAAVMAGLWAWRNSQYKQIRKKLTRDVTVVSDMLMTANNELRKRQTEINKRNQEITAINSNLQDIVEKRTKELTSAKAKAEESSQLKSDFLASLGHEVRTPMNAIVGFAKLLQMEKCSDEERREFADLILKSATSLLGMLGALLDSSRIERGVLEISIADTNIYQEVNDAYRMLSVEKKNPDVEFLLNLADNLKGTIIATDKERLRQVIINITYNAFKFTSKGYVRMSAWKTKASGLTRLGLPNFPQKLSFTTDVFVMSIEDTGCGIPADKQTIIFEPFRRLTGNAIKHPGLGLGLNIVKNLITLMGGEIWLTSEVGKGSTFFFYLPFEGPKFDTK